VTWRRAARRTAVAVAALLWTSGAAWAGDPGVPKAPPTSESDVDALLFATPEVALAVVLARFVPAVIGLVLLAIEFVQWRDVRRGLVAPPAPASPPTSPFSGRAPGLDLLTAFGLWVALQVLAAMAITAAASVWPGSEELLGVQLIATGMGSVPIALWVIARRAEARRAPPPVTTPEQMAEVVFGEGRLQRLPARGKAKRTAYAFFVASAAVLAFGFAAALLLKGFGEEPTVQPLVTQVLRPALALDPWLVLGFGVLIAPWAEEALFRGAMYPAMRRVAGRWTGAVVVSAAFAAVHMSLTAALPLFALAMILTWLFEKTDSILAPTVVHALNNAASLIPLLLASGRS
jgi:membrane protease YdiL (CAAX protease family)